MLYTFIVLISIPNCKSIAHFLSPKWGIFYLQKLTNYDVRFQSRFVLFLGVVRKNKWHHWISKEKLVQMLALPPVPIRRYRLHASIHGRHPLSPKAKLVMHCGSCCDALWVTADAAAGARPGDPATRWYKRVSRSRIGASWHLEKRCSGSQLIGECDGDKIKEGSWRT